MELDHFDNKYLVGRYFKSKEEALEYLKVFLIKDNSTKTIDDYDIVDSNDNTLRPFRIFPKPSDRDKRRAEAEKFIKEKCLVKTIIPKEAYFKYSDIAIVKELGIKYTFKPIGKVNLNNVLSDFLKSKGHTNSINGNELMLYNFSKFDILDEHGNEFDDDEALIIKKDIEDLLNEFNSILGTEFYISETIKKETSDSIARTLRHELDSEKYGPNSNIKYQGISFILERYNEDEFIGIIPFSPWNDKIEMI